MLPKQFEKLPAPMQNESVRPYFDALNKKRGYLKTKRLFDVAFSAFALTVASPFMLLTALAIKATSKGPVFYRQTRIGALGKEFGILKFRTMIPDADKKGMHITVGADASRITRVGRILRKLKIDELPQFINVLRGEMTIVGTRPEVMEYVEHYTPEMAATLLLPPGIVNKASIIFSNESEILGRVRRPERYYIYQILPEKMHYNLEYLMHASMLRDLTTIFMTVGCVLGMTETKELPQPTRRQLTPTYARREAVKAS